MPGELAALRSPEIPSVSGSGFIQSPEIPLARNSRLVIPSTPQTPTPGPSNRPLGSPIRYMSPPEEFPLDPTLQRASINPGPTSISVTSNISGSPDETESSLQDHADAVVVNIQSQNESKKTVTKRLTSSQISYQPNNRIRETYYRNQSERVRESVKKLGIYTGCYGILLLLRNVLIVNRLIV